MIVNVVRSIDVKLRFAWCALVFLRPRIPCQGCYRATDILDLLFRPSSHVTTVTMKGKTCARRTRGRLNNGADMITVFYQLVTTLPNGVDFIPFKLQIHVNALKINKNGTDCEGWFTCGHTGPADGLSSTGVSHYKFPAWTHFRANFANG